MQVRADILLLFDADGPEPLNALLRLRRGAVVMTFVWVDFCDAEGEEGEGEKFEDLGGGGFGGYGGKGGVFLCGGFLVGGRLEGPKGAFDCVGSLASVL